MRIKNIVNQKFGRLTVIKFSHISEKKRSAIWDCECECGKTHKASGTNLRAGQVKSCGCLQVEKSKAQVPKNYKDLTGHIFGRLTVLSRSDIPKKGVAVSWKCKCVCGNIKDVITGNLTLGKQVSCGCFNRERSKDSHTTHGLSRTRMYRIWAGMISRCYNSNVQHYPDYGGRGIGVSDEWKNDFMVFYKDMKDTYNDTLQIDRIDVNGNYCKENCKWSTYKEQSRNRRNSVYLTVDGDRKLLVEWAEDKNIDKQLLHSRRQGGFTDKQVVFGKIKVPIENMKLPKKPKYM